MTIDIPCRIGDTVWCIRNVRGIFVPMTGEVSEMAFDHDMKIVIVVKNVSRGTWGERVFATHDDAKAECIRRNTMR